VHVHPSGPHAAVNCFNLSDKTVRREAPFDPGRYGMDGGLSYRIEGADARKDGNVYRAAVEIPAYGHTLLEIRPA